MGSTSYLTRGKGSRGSYGTYKPAKSTSSIGSDKDIGSKLKRTKARRSGKLGDYPLKRTPDYTELAYKEAVSRLRYFLSGNLAHGYRSYGGTASIKNLDESDNEEKKYQPPAPVSYSGGVKPRLTAKYSQLYADSLRNFNQFPNDAASKASSGGAEPNATSPEVVHFIQKQEEYIEQLERESQYCRDELNNLLGKVKEVISENEHLHEAQKNKLISRMFDSYGGSETDELDDIGDSTGLDSDTKASPSKVRKSAKPGRSSRLEGPNIVFESRIAELEAQLTQAKIEQKKIQDENNENRRKLAEGLVDSSCLDGFKRQIDNLQRDKASLEAHISKLKLTLDQRDSDSDLGSRTKRGNDLVEQQLREERNNLEAEVRRLKEDLNSQRGKVRELAGEGARRAIQERSAAEQRYTSHLDEMANELAAQYDNVSKLQLELDRQRRDELDLKRELSMKTAAIDELKMELKGKTASLQADLAQAHAEKSSLEEELASARLAIERHQRQAKHETNRFNSEIQSLRQRLDRADADLVHSRRENLRLSEEIAKLEKDLKLGNLTPASPVKSNKDKELANMLENMENKHAHTVAELEAMIQSQNSLMDKLTGECRVLTDKLDHASRRHKQSAESQPNRPTNENTARRLWPGKREPPFLQTPCKRVRFVETERSSLLYRNQELMRKLRSLWCSHKKYCTSTIYRGNTTPRSGYPHSRSSYSEFDRSYVTSTPHYSESNIDRKVDTEFRLKLNSIDGGRYCGVLNRRFSTLSLDNLDGMSDVCDAEKVGNVPMQDLIKCVVVSGIDVQELAALQRQVEGISQSFQHPATINAPTANTYQAPAPTSANVQDSSRTHTPTRNDYPRTEPTRDTQIHRQPSDAGNGDHRNGQARKLSKQASRDSFVPPVAAKQNYNNDDIQIPPDKFEEKDDNTTEKEQKIKDEPQHDVDGDVAKDTGGDTKGERAYADPQYEEQNYQQQQQNEYQPQYQTDEKTYPQEQTYTDQQYNAQPEYEGSEYNQGYPAEYTDGQYENQPQYPNQQYAEGEYAGQTYEQQQYDYSTDPNYQSSADQNYQGDQNYVTDPNYKSTPDPNYSADPNYKSTPDPNYSADPNYQTAPVPNYAPDPSYQTAVDPNYAPDPSYQTAVDPNYAPDPSYQTAADPNYAADPSYQTATNPSFAEDSSYQNATQPNYETDPKYASTVQKAESTLKPGNNSPNPQNRS